MQEEGEDVEGGQDVGQAGFPCPKLWNDPEKTVRLPPSRSPAQEGEWAQTGVRQEGWKEFGQKLLEADTVLLLGL